LLVDADSTQRADLQAGLARHLHVGAHTHGQDDHVGLDVLSLVTDDDQLVMCRALDGRQGRRQTEFHPLTAQFLLHGSHHFGVQRGHHLVRALHERDFHAAAHEVFGHLQADEAAADDYSAGRLALVDPGAQVIHLLQATDGENPGQIQSGKGWPDRRGAGRKHQRVVGHAARRAGDHVGHFHGLGSAVDRAHLMTRAYLDVVPVAEAFRRGDQESCARLNHIAQVIRQPAIGKRHVGAPFVDEDLRLFIKPAQSRRTRRAACHSAHDHYALPRHKLLLVR